MNPESDLDPAALLDANRYQMTNTPTRNVNSIKSLLGDGNLNGVNFLGWNKKVRAYFRHERKEYVIDNVLPGKPTDGATQEVIKAYQKHIDDAFNVGATMLCVLAPDLRMQFMELFDNPHQLMKEIEIMFKAKSTFERYDTFAKLESCKLLPGRSVGPHVLKMKGYIDYLSRLGLDMQNEIAVDFILRSLPDIYGGFIINYNMRSEDKTVLELHEMLITAENSFKSKKAKRAHVVEEENKNDGEKYQDDQRKDGGSTSSGARK